MHENQLAKIAFVEGKKITTITEWSAEMVGLKFSAKGSGNKNVWEIMEYHNDVTLPVVLKCIHCGYTCNTTVNMVFNKKLRSCPTCKYIGMKYSNYTILDYAHTTTSAGYRFHCRCSCGNITVVSLSQLKNYNDHCRKCSTCGAKAMDLTSKTIGTSKVLKRIARRGKPTLYECVCSCGNLYTVTGSQLTGKHTHACRCCHRRHDMSYLYVYRLWRYIYNVCYTESLSTYKQYGARGVTMCNEWKNDPKVFYSDVGEIPEHKSLNLINPYGDYKKSNCIVGVRQRIDAKRKCHPEFNPESYPEHLRNNDYYNLNEFGFKIFKL